MKADKGQQGDKGHSTSLRSSQGNLPEVFIEEGPYGASLRAKEGVGINGNTILARDYVDPRAEEYVRRANAYAELMGALERITMRFYNFDNRHPSLCTNEAARQLLAEIEADVAGVFAKAKP